MRNVPNSFRFRRTLCFFLLHVILMCLLLCVYVFCFLRARARVAIDRPLPLNERPYPQLAASGRNSRREIVQVDRSHSTGLYKKIQDRDQASSTRLRAMTRPPAALPTPNPSAPRHFCLRLTVENLFLSRDTRAGTLTTRSTSWCTATCASLSGYFSTCIAAAAPATRRLPTAGTPRTLGVVARKEA